MHPQAVLCNILCAIMPLMQDPCLLQCPDGPCPLPSGCFIFSAQLLFPHTGQTLISRLFICKAIILFFLQGQEGIASDQSHEVYMSFYEALGLKLVSFLPVHRDVP